jgi:signal transduction histidine kinase
LNTRKILAWVFPFLIFFLATLLSSTLKTPQGVTLFYLPIPIGILLVQWWGLRIIPALILNSFLTLIVWDSHDFRYWPFLVSHEAIAALASWYFFRVRFSGKPWLPDLKNTLNFLLLGIIIPVTFNAIFILLLSKREPILIHTLMVWTADFTSSFVLCLPMLYFFTPWLSEKRLIDSLEVNSDHLKSTYRTLMRNKTEAILSILLLPAFSLFLPMEKYWFIYGVFTVYIAVRFGFGNTLLANTLVFFIAYVVPLMFPTNRDFSWAIEGNLINIHLGMILLSVTACITGRVISDLRRTRKKLNRQFLELENTHRELDRFVYSASHDLSAPLKSIRGLIHISKMEPDPSKHIQYITRMETSAAKLENYIHEIIDYSKNNRSRLELEKIDVYQMVQDVLDDLMVSEHFNHVSFHYELFVNEIVADRIRIKIILNNLISNALQYQKINDTIPPSVWIHSESSAGLVRIQVRDNGQGIRPELLDKVFNMFFRGTFSSAGSGLGLYIARQAALKMNGSIEVQSDFGFGSSFTFVFPKYFDLTISEPMLANEEAS